MPYCVPKPWQISTLQDIIYCACVGWFPNELIAWNHRPGWLHGMELDIFLPKIGMAIEVQGRQHSYYCPKYHKTLKDYEDGLWRDLRKIELALEQGIALFHVHEGHRGVLGGLPHRINKQLGLGLKTEPWIASWWQNHNKALNIETHRGKTLCFKVKRRCLIPFNKASSEFLKRNPMTGVNENMVTINAPAVSHSPALADTQNG